MAFTLNRETSMGLVRLDEIATGFRYVKSYSSKANGSWLATRPEEIFCVFEDLGPPSWKLQENMALVCTPVCQLPEFLPPIRNPIGGSMRPPGSLRFIPWLQHGKALVLATDPNFIADVWLAFVPLSDIRKDLA